MMNALRALLLCNWAKVVIKDPNALKFCQHYATSRPAGNGRGSSWSSSPR